MIAHINDVLYNGMCVVKERVKLYFNLHILSLDPATSSDCYKCKLTSVLATIHNCSSHHYLTSYFQNMFDQF